MSRPAISTAPRGESITALFQELHAGGLTIVVVTHNIALAAVAQRQLRLADGKLVTEETREPRRERRAKSEIRLYPRVKSCYREITFNRHEHEHEHENFRTEVSCAGSGPVLGPQPMLTRLPAMTNTQIDQLLPQNWKPVGINTS